MNIKSNKKLKQIFLDIIDVSIKSFDDIGVIFRYGISGLISIATNLLVIYILTDIFGLWHIVSAPFAFLTSFIVAFSLQKYWTFKGARHSSVHFQAFSYLLVALGALIANIIFLYIFVDIFRFWYLGVQSVILIITAGVSFIVNKNITFGRNRGINSEDS